MDQEEVTCAVCGKPIATRTAFHVLTYQDKATGKYREPGHYVHMDPEEGGLSGCGFGYNGKFNATDVVMVEVDLAEEMKKLQE
jgi:hypothetical protein